MNNTNRTFQETQYFDLRNSPQLDSEVKKGVLPSYITNLLPHNKDARILDIGCGFGGLLLQLRLHGYRNIHGIDINDAAIEFCKEKKLDVIKTDSIIDYGNSYNDKKYDLIIMTHIIEHIKKDEIIATLAAIKKLLKEDGKLYLTTPNAQSRSGCYWAYEDFTHEVLFTSGSLYYVLSAAGFTNVIFLDPNNTDNSRFKLIKNIFLSLYKLNDKFWNKMTGAAYHPNSPIIYSWEIKVEAK